MRARSNFPLALRLAVAACLGLVAAAGAGTTGKLQGRVVDEQQKPLPGVNVRIEGQRLGAATDDEGTFVIVGAPAGVHIVRFNLLGYAPHVAEKVTIVADFTTTLDVTLKTEAVQMGEVRVEAQRPLLQRDATGTTRYLSADEIQKMPTRGYREAAAQQTGVVDFQRNIDSETQNQNTLIVRGGRPNEVAYFVDGFSQQDPLTGTSSTAINNNAIQEVVLLTGGFNAEYGRIMSGAVNVVTREGGSRYSGAFEAVTDALSGSWVNAPITDYNVYGASLGGPVRPGHDDLTFYLSGERRWQQDRAPAFHSIAFRDHLESAGMDPGVTPNNWASGWTGQGKLSWSMSDKRTLKLGTLVSQESWREYLGAYLYNLEHTPRYSDRNQSYFATLNNVIDSRAYWNLSVNHFDTQRKRGDGVAFDDLMSYYIPSNPRFDENIPMFYSPGHIVNNYLQRSSSYWGVQGGYTSQITPHNQLRVGGDVQRHTLRFLQHYRPTSRPGTTGFDDNWDGYGYDLKYHRDSTGAVYRVDIEDQDDGDDGAKHPLIWSTYVQDKFERDGLVVNGGLRFDYIDTNTPALANPITPLEDGPYPDSLDSQDLADSKAYSRLSPRLGILFPLDDRTLIRFNYGQFYQQPNLQDLYASYRFLEFKLNTGGYFVGFGNPNLRPERTTAYEVGMQRQVGDNVRLDVTAYYKDVKDLVEITSIPASPKSFTTYRNRDFATIKGLDIGFGMRRTNHISGSVNYSLSFASGTGSVSNTQGNVAWVAGPSPKQTSPLDFDQRHKLSINGDFTLEKGQGPQWGGMRPFENLGVNVLFNIASGTPFTPTQPYNELTLAAVTALVAGPLNSRYGPWTQTLDFKITRGFDLQRTRLDAFFWVINAFDNENAIAVFTSSGSAKTTGWLNTDPGRAYLATAEANGQDGLGLYRLAEGDPNLYGTPRLVRFGARMSF